MRWASRCHRSTCNTPDPRAHCSPPCGKRAGWSERSMRSLLGQAPPHRLPTSGGSWSSVARRKGTRRPARQACDVAIKPGLRQLGSTAAGRRTSWPSWPPDQRRAEGHWPHAGPTPPRRLRFQLGRPGPPGPQRHLELELELGSKQPARTIPTKSCRPQAIFHRPASARHNAAGEPLDSALRTWEHYPEPMTRGPDCNTSVAAVLATRHGLIPRLCGNTGWGGRMPGEALVLVAVGADVVARPARVAREAAGGAQSTRPRSGSGSGSAAAALDRSNTPL